MIKFRALKWRDYLGGPSVITKVLIRKRQEDQSQGRRCDDGSRVIMREREIGRCHTTNYEDAVWGHELRKIGSHLLKAERARRLILS